MTIIQRKQSHNNALLKILPIDERYVKIFLYVCVLLFNLFLGLVVYTAFKQKHGDMAIKEQKPSSIQRFMEYYSYINGTSQINEGNAYLTKNVCIERGIWKMRSSHGTNPLDELLKDGALRYDSNLVTYSTEYMYDITSGNFSGIISESDIVILVGQLTTNIGHFIRDCFWLDGMMNSLENRFGSLTFYVIFTKFAKFNDIHTKKARVGANQKEIEKLRAAEAYNLFMINIVLHNRKYKVAFSRELDHKCFGSVIQNRKDGLSTNFVNAQKYQESVLKFCNITRTKPLYDLVAQHEKRKSIGNLNELSQVGFVTQSFGQVREPCEQVRVATTLKCFVSVHGADLSHMVWMEPGTTVIELAPSWQIRRFNNSCDAEEERLSMTRWRESSLSGWKSNGKVYNYVRSKYDREKICTEINFTRSGYYSQWAETLRLNYVSLEIPHWDGFSDLNLTRKTIEQITKLCAE